MGKPDKNLRGVASNELVQNETINGNGYADAVKLSNVTGARIIDCYIVGGYEDAIDQNRGGNTLVEGCCLNSGGNFVATIKGGAHDVTFKNCHIGVRGKETDIDLGNWSEQSMATTKRITIDGCTTEDGKPIRVRCLWADDPIVINSNVKLTRVHPILLWFFKLAKKLGIA